MLVSHQQTFFMKIESSFINWPVPASFSFVCIIFKKCLAIEIVNFKGSQTQIVRVEGEHADHLTTMGSLKINSFLNKLFFVSSCTWTKKKYFKNELALVAI